MPPPGEARGLGQLLAANQAAPMPMAITAAVIPFFMNFPS
jgi:hypothetical protein